MNCACGHNKNYHVWNYLKDGIERKRIGNCGLCNCQMYLEAEGEVKPMPRGVYERKPPQEQAAAGGKEKKAAAKPEPAAHKVETITLTLPQDLVQQLVEIAVTAALERELERRSG